MKSKKLKIFIIALIFISVLTVIYFGTTDWLKTLFAADALSREEMCVTLTENLGLFEDAVDVLKNGEYIKISRVAYDFPPPFNLIFKNQIKIEGNVSEELRKKIKKSSINQIMCGLDFVIITSQNGCISFVNRTAIGYSPQLVYSVNGGELDPLIFKDVEKITGNWYYSTE